MNEFKYLDLLEEINKKLDIKQKEVCCRTDNTIVAAGAGSGKTQVLATRFAWLVMSQNIKVSQILTLTFTKKAAGEMYERIYQTLNFFACNPKTPELEKQRALKALEEFSESHIQTLDSYCATIVRQAANRYGINPDFTCGKGDSETEIKNLALPFVFSNRDRLSIKTFAKTGKLQDFANDYLAAIISKYTSLADEPDYFSNKSKIQQEIILNAYNKIFCNNSIKASLPKDTIDYPTIIAQLKKEYNNAYKQKGNTPYLQQVLTILDGFESIEINVGKNLDGIQSTSEQITKIFEIINTYKWNVSGWTKPLQSVMKTFRENFVCVAHSICSYINQHKAIEDLFLLIDEFSKKSNDSKRKSGNVSFKDISELALKILKEQDDLRFQEQQAYEKIMIDEFQDNNSKNRDLLFLLADGKQKLFFVGDEKQSIYKFRGADVSVFNQLKNDLGSQNFLQMNYNYRSCPELLSTFNILFGSNVSIFDNSTENLFEAKYTSNAIKFNPTTQKELPPVILNQSNFKTTVTLFTEEDIQNQKMFFNAKDQMAIHLCKSILNKMEEIEKSENRKPSFSEFAILDRNRSHRHNLVKWLNYFNIPYTLDQNSSLFSDGPINDIYNFLQLCIYPQDTISLAGFLSSPFANLSEQAIECILAKGNLQEELPQENEKYLNALNFLKEQRQLTLGRTITTTISALWNDFGYKYETIQNNDTILYEEQFDMLFELARTTEQKGQSITWFVDQLGKIKDKEISAFADDVEIDAEELTYPIEKNDAVNVMTIHKSKGLQFNYVFVYGCLNVSSKEKNEDFFFEEDTGLSVKTEAGVDNYFYTIQKKLSKQKELAEFRRIIYVALTRAIKTIEIVGPWDPSSKSDESEISFKLLENVINYYMEADPSIQKPFDIKICEPYKRESFILSENKTLKNLKQDKYKTAIELFSDEAPIKYEWPVSNRKTPSSLEEDYSAQQAQDTDTGLKYETTDDILNDPDFGAADFGTLIHAYLEAQANGINCDDFEPDAKLLKNLSETPEELLKIIQQCKKMCHSFSQSIYGKQLDCAKTSGRFFKAEWAFRMFHQKNIFTGSIDLIYKNEDETYTIIDYKSDTTLNFQKYIGQQNCYRVAASKLLNIDENKINCFLYFLRFDKAIDLTNILQEQQKMEL